MLADVAVSQINAGIQVSVDYMTTHRTDIDPVPELEIFIDVSTVRTGLRTREEQIGKYDFDPFHTGLVFDLSSELRPHLFAHCFGKGMVLHHVSDLQIFHNDCFWQRVDDLSGDLMDIVGPQVFQFLMNTGNDLFLLLIVPAFPQWTLIDWSLMRLVVFSDDLFIMVDVGLLLAGQAFLLLQQSSFQFSDP